MSLRLCDQSTVLRPTNAGLRISLYFAFEQKPFAIVLLSYGRLFSKSRCNTVDLSVEESFVFITQLSPMNGIGSNSLFFWFIGR